MSKMSGNAMVEFALVVPVLLVMFVMAFRVGLSAVQQFGWDRLCTQTVRSLSLTSAPTQPELLAEARRLLSDHEPSMVRVVVQPVPTQPPQSPYRVDKQVELIDLTIEKEKKPFRVRSYARGVRVRLRTGE